LIEFIGLIRLEHTALNQLNSSDSINHSPNQPLTQSTQSTIHLINSINHSPNQPLTK